MKNKFNKVFSLVLVLLMTVGMIPLTVTAASEKDLSYVTESDNGLTITACDKNASGELTIPSSIDGHTVMRIGPNAFKGCSKLTAVVIPETVNAVSNYAFANCTSLKSVTIPESVTSIGGYIFSGSKNVTVYGYIGTAAEACANQLGLPFVSIGGTKTLVDEATKISVKFSGAVLDSRVKLVVSENGSAYKISGKPYGKIKIYDITYKLDGKTVKPKGEVYIKIPVPEDFDRKTSSVYSISGKSAKKQSMKIKSGYFCFNTSETGQFAVVDESTEGLVPKDKCSCFCHKSGFAGIMWKVLRFYQKLFRINQYCDCGDKHW